MLLLIQGGDFGSESGLLFGRTAGGIVGMFVSMFPTFIEVSPYEGDEANKPLLTIACFGCVVILVIFV